MKLHTHLTICIWFALAACSSADKTKMPAIGSNVAVDGTPPTDTAFTKQPAGTILNFLKWYRTNVKQIKQIELVRHSTSPDSIMRSYMYGDGRGATLSSDDKSGTLMIYPDKGQSREPEITGVQVKKGKKLTISGQNFTANSMLLINGRMVKPNAFTAGKQLSYKGKLNAAGTNELYVLNSSGKSSLFQF